MNIDWTFLLSALGLALVFEGIPYFAAPKSMPKYLLNLAQQPPKMLRFLGLTAMILGILIIFLARSLP